MTTKYIARHDGKIVGKRSTKSRTYTHAIVVLADEAKARDRAYNYVPTETDRSNFKYYLSIVACEGKFIEPGPGVSDLRDPKDVGQVLKSWPTHKQYVSGYDAKEMAYAKAHTADGWDGYIAHLRKEAIERFEKSIADGGYTPCVVGWAGRLDLAQKEASRQAKYYAKVWIVPAEQVTPGKKEPA